MLVKCLLSLRRLRRSESRLGGCLRGRHRLRWVGLSSVWSSWLLIWMVIRLSGYYWRSSRGLGIVLLVLLPLLSIAIICVKSSSLITRRFCWSCCLGSWSTRPLRILCCPLRIESRLSSGLLGRPISRVIRLSSRLGGRRAWGKGWLLVLIGWLWNKRILVHSFRKLWPAVFLRAQRPLSMSTTCKRLGTYDSSSCYFWKAYFTTLVM